MRWLLRRAPRAPFLLLVLAGCGGGDEHAGEARAQNLDARIPYREVTVPAGGRLVGRLLLPDEGPAVAGAPARDTCGVRLPRGTWEERDPVRALVWIADVRAGKSLPVERRFALTIEHCDAAPRIQGALAGGTLNVLNLDPATHHTRFLGAGDVTLDVVQQFEAGQLVPKTQLLGTPGLIEVRCDVHPWMRAWIAVFDQPYFAEVRGDGAFALDSVPPGEHRIVYWHPAAGRREHRVTVTPNGESNVELPF